MSGRRVLAVLVAMLIASGAVAAADGSRPWIAPDDGRQAATHSDQYAWRLFVALNWPADRAGRAADPKAAFGADGPVTWEVWQDANDVYLEDGGDPGAWGAEGSTPVASSAVADESRFETVSLKDIPIARHIVGGRMVPLTDPVADAKRLTEIRMNRATFEYIRANELYNVDGQLRLIAAARAVNFPSAATEVKAKWRPIRADERERYHTVTVRLADGTERLYGLTALHIVSKALPQWFWATFEHVDNPTLPGADGWQLLSSDRFACAGEADNCNRAPRGIGLEGTVWQNYRLRGTLTRFVDDGNRPLLLANSELEAGMQQTSSCMTCHARSVLALVGGAPTRLPIFDTSMVADEAAVSAAPAATAAPTANATLAASAAPAATAAAATTAAGSTASDGLRAPGFERRGFVGLPRPQWFEDPTSSRKRLFESLDFVWSLSKARPRKVPHET
jgi:hypothetical protein